MFNNKKIVTRFLLKQRQGKSNSFLAYDCLTGDDVFVKFGHQAIIKREWFCLKSCELMKKKYPVFYPFVSISVARNFSWLVRSWQSGFTLLEYCNRKRKVELFEFSLSGMLFKLFIWLRYFHKMGWVHYDIKPSNVFFDMNSVGQYSVCMIDFGSALPIGFKLSKVLFREFNYKYSSKKVRLGLGKALPMDDWISFIKLMCDRDIVLYSKEKI